MTNQFSVRDGPGEEESVRFKVEYRVESKKRNIFQRIFGGSDEVKLTLNLETRGSTCKTDLEVDTSSLVPGSYELTLRAMEPSTGREERRKVSFGIIASDTP